MCMKVNWSSSKGDNSSQEHFVSYFMGASTKERPCSLKGANSFLKEYALFWKGLLSRESGRLAHLVAHLTREPKVPGSIPGPAT